MSYLASPGDWVRVTEVYGKRPDKVQPGFVGKVRGITSQEGDPSWWPGIVFESGQSGNFHIERWEPRIGDLCEWTYDEKTVRGTIKRLEDGDIWVVLSNGQCGPLSNAARATLRPAAGSVDAAHRETAGAEPSGKAPQDSARPDPYVLHEAKLAALTGAEREAFQDWHQAQAFTHLARYKQGLREARSPWDWEPPEDFEVCK